MGFNVSAKKKLALLVVCILVTQTVLAAAITTNAQTMSPAAITTKAQEQTIDIAIIGLAGYPFKETLSEPSTPPHSIYVGVMVNNNGTETTTFNVTVYLNMVPTFVSTNVVLNAGETTILTYTTTSDDLGKDTFALSALAVAPGDKNPGNNYYAHGSICISIVGDVNCDGIVDIRDLAVVARYQGLSATVSPPWIPEVDQNMDGIIDIFDLAYYSQAEDWNNFILAYIAFGSMGPHPWEWAWDQYRDGQLTQEDLDIISKHYGEIDP